MLLKAAGFEAVPMLKRAIKRTDEALDATTPVVRIIRVDVLEERGGEADHRVRLDAADRVFRLSDVLPRPDDDDRNSDRPVAVTIIRAGNGASSARTPVQAGRVQLHLEGDQRE